MSVGTDHDPPVFALTSIEAWWKQVGEQRYPKARELFNWRGRPLRSFETIINLIEPDAFHGDWNYVTGPRPKRR